jgi:hydrophobic/amphiphilic exporter-1 (mainly G- bacteria), HAE1 family
VLLKDVGHSEVGAEDYSTGLKYKGHSAMGIGVEQLSNANALEVDRKAKAALAELSKSFPPGLEYAIAFDSTTVVGDSIREVLVTLAEAIVIVITVIFLFLLDWRATIIPAVTIPVSLIGTFAFIKIFGFSINSLTLFGITLATGLVVDDAIVVIENVQRHIHMEHSDPHEATSRAMGEVTSAVIATSLVLIAVFVPVSFFPGTTGILYRQFSLTIAFAIAISAFNALTLSPALSALFLRGEEARPRSWTFCTSAPSRAPLPLHSRRRRFRSVGWPAPTRASFMSRCNCATCCCWSSSPGWAPRCGSTSTFPPAFIPQEDQGYLMVIVQAPPGSSLAYTTALADARRPSLRRIPTSPDPFSMMGFSFAGSASNAGMMFVNTNPPISGAAKATPTRTSSSRPFAQIADADVRSQWRPGGHVRASGGAGRGQLWRIPVHAAGPGRQHAQRPGPRGAPDCGRRPRKQGS